MRGLAYKRYQRRKHIKRKERIIRGYRTDNPPHKYDDSKIWNTIKLCKPALPPISEGMWEPYWIVPNRGYLDKGKIHCSCWMCRVKTKNKGKNSNPNLPVRYYKKSELKKILRMNYDENNWEQEKREINEDSNFDEVYGFLKNKFSEEFYESLKGGD